MGKKKKNSWNSLRASTSLVLFWGVRLSPDRQMGRGSLARLMGSLGGAWGPLGSPLVSLLAFWGWSL